MILDLLKATGELFGNCVLEEGGNVNLVVEDVARELTPVELAQVTVRAEEMQAEYVANAYARSRKAEYDKLNQFELMTDDARDGTTTHAEAIEAIKAEFPKPV